MTIKKTSYERFPEIVLEDYDTRKLFIEVSEF